MANYRKPFNFRNGVQVDNDNFIVNENGLVGIGTLVPTEALDLYGTAKFGGLTTSKTLGVAETANFYGPLNIGSNVSIDPTTGDISAVRFVGDASGLTNIVAIATVGWIAQGVGLNTSKSIGIGTTNPEYSLQVGENPVSGSGVAIESNGNVRVSGAITASSFNGGLIGNVTGDVTGNVTGDLTGVASEATALETARDFSITGAIEASAVSFDATGNVVLNSSISSTFDANTTGIITASSFVGDLTATTASITNADVGIGTFDEIKVNKTTAASIDITSNTSSSISIGKSELGGNESVELRYTPSIGRFDINNYDLGGVTINLHEGTGAGTTEGFDVRYDNDKKFEVTYDGKVGVNRSGATLTNNFEVGGDTYITGNSTIVGVLTVGQGGNQLTLGDGSPLPLPTSQNFNTLSGVSTFNDINAIGGIEAAQDSVFYSNLFVDGVIGIGTTSNLEFVSGLGGLSQQIFGSSYITSSLITGSELAISASADGSLLEDPRTIPDGFGSIVPYLSYGGFQVETGAASFVSENLLVVPKPAVVVAGFSSSNLGLVPSNYNTNKYLSKVGINTFFARSIFDVGTASTTMNSYFIPPSMPQSELDIVSNLWQATSGFGTEQSRKVTPDGVVPGAMVYNTDAKPSHLGASAGGELQVGIDPTTFAAVGVPIGGIIMWSGSIVNIPNGWRLCDGNNNTPDLRDRFIVGAGSAYNVDDTGGSADAVVVSHTHTITDPGHDHTYSGETTELVESGTNNITGSEVGISSTTSTETTGITETDSEGVSGTNANLPPYYALAFIMRTNA